MAAKSMSVKLIVAMVLCSVLHIRGAVTEAGRKGVPLGDLL